MSNDARFEDGTEEPLRLAAQSSEDLQVISALVQDAVFPITEMQWDKDQMRFGLFINRFRWEDKDQAEAQKRVYERVQAVMMFDSVVNVATSGIDTNDKDTVLSLLDIGFAAGDDGTGVLRLNLAGDGAIKLDVECIDIRLKDVTKPYGAPSKSAPSHKLD